MKRHYIIGIFLLAFNCWGMTKQERRDLFQGATQRLKQTQIEQRALKKGDTFPNIQLSGKSIDEWLKSGLVLFTVYRGGWCPYCVKQLKDYQSRLKEISSHHVQLFAISPETNKEVAKTKRKNDLNFQLISDKNHKLLRTLNLVFKVEKDVVAEYKKLGIDLSASQGNSSNELPIPATYLIGNNRKILYSFVDADYTKRASIDEIIAALKN